MNKRTTTIAGIALGASLLAGAGYGLYTFLRKKFNRVTDSITGANAFVNQDPSHGFVGGSLVKSDNLYSLGHADNDLVAGGLYKDSPALY